MTRSEQLIAAAERALTPNYRRQPVVMERGEGCRLWDVDGREYLDMTAGIAVCLLGHAHPRLARAVAEQAARLVHASNLYHLERQIAFAERLRGCGFAGRVFFCNSGAEANEAALKLARRVAVTVRGEPDRVEVVAFEGSFHGRSVATVSATGQPKYRAGFGPLWEFVRFAPFGDLAAARAAVGPRTCAVIVEVIQGEGGVRPAPAGFLAGLRAACDAAGALLLVDEVQTGVGRTGDFYAHAAEGVAPDVVTLAKGLAGGVPCGAVLAREEIAGALAPGTHASTFGGNPLACAAGLAVLDAIDDERLLERCRAMGARLRAGLERLARGRAACREVRGRGLLLGLALAGDAAPVVDACRERGLLVSAAGGDVVRFAPPLVVGEAEIDEALARLAEALGSSGPA